MRQFRSKRPSPASMTDADLERLRVCRTVADWDAAVGWVRARHSGALPYDWHAWVVTSGLMDAIFADMVDIEECDEVAGGW